MIVMDRRNLCAVGWSHVVSTANDVAELEGFRIRIGAPAVFDVRRGADTGSVLVRRIPAP